MYLRTYVLHVVRTFGGFKPHWGRGFKLVLNLGVLPPTCTLFPLVPEPVPMPSTGLFFSTCTAIYEIDCPRVFVERWVC